jgi:hypothetical protein
MDNADDFQRHAKAAQVALDWRVTPEYVEPFLDEHNDANYALDDFFREDLPLGVISSPNLRILKSHFTSTDAKQKLLSFIIENGISVSSELGLFLAIQMYFESLLSQRFVES